MLIDQLVSLAAPAGQCQPGANVGPIAVGELATVVEDSIDNPIDVLAGDSDPDEDPLTIDAVSDPGHGTATIDAPNHQVLYTPDPDYSGPDSFTYTISDGRGKTATATETIDVLPINDIPLSTGTSVATDRNVDLPIDLGPLASDLETADANLTWQNHGTAHPRHFDRDRSGPDLPTECRLHWPRLFSFTVTDRDDPTPAGLSTTVHCTAPLTSSPGGLVLVPTSGTRRSTVRRRPWQATTSSGPRAARIALDGTATDVVKPEPDHPLDVPRRRRSGRWGHMLLLAFGGRRRPEHHLHRRWELHRDHQRQRRGDPR